MLVQMCLSTVTRYARVIYYLHSVLSCSAIAFVSFFSCIAFLFLTRKAKIIEITRMAFADNPSNSSLTKLTTNY